MVHLIRFKWAAAIALILGTGVFFAYPTLAYQYFLQKGMQALEAERFEEAEEKLRQAERYHKTGDVY